MLFRSDADTRKTLEHGRRIRACLKQAELAPVSVAAQITVLLALGAGLFDRVPLERMTAAEGAVQAAVARIPDALLARFEATDRLSEAEREAIIDIAREALEQHLPEGASGAHAGTDADAALERPHEPHGETPLAPAAAKPAADEP